MDTLRERQPSLLRAAPDREVTTHSNGSATVSIIEVTAIAGDMVDGADIVNVAVCAPLSPTDCTERFAHNYQDPEFPCRSVSYAATKRAFDILFAGAFLLVAFLPMLIIALLVKLTSRGPVLFKQVRVGRGGRYFYCLKFRSMCADAEAIKEQLMHLNEASGPVFKIKHDPRITPIGAFLRKYSIDELPQFINVLMGDMSIVGPRPPIPNEVSAYTAHQRQRLAIRPGLTCLWQVNGRSNLSFERWVELDLEYMDTMSFGADVKIVLKTIPAVIKGSGAH